ncbi:pectinesterase family protein, partial [Streptomyces prasinus]|uniref:pectinesterase family protein n=1 Tax=Streptomyces prasinus TaxID=67345 RepID=UPI000A6C7FA4
PVVAAPVAAAAAPAWATATADGFASVDALGQNGTYGGRDGAIVTVRTQAELERYATAAEPYVIVVAGTITMNPVGKEIKVASDKTIVGSGTSGHIVGGGFFLGQGVHNVIIRNLTIRDAYQGVWNDKDHDFDAVQMDGAHHVWIDHNDLRNMADGLIDVRKDSTYVTVSWNRMSHNNKAFGIGWTENVLTDITIHHNWIRETEQRNPSTDNCAHAHLYNNFLEDTPGTDITSSYGNYARGGTRMVLENSYFQGFRNPVTKDATASLVQRGSVFSGTSGRNESGGTAFDPRTYYAYTLDRAADVPALLKSGAGPRGSLGTTTASGTATGTATSGTIASGAATGTAVPVTGATTAALPAAAATTLTVAKDGTGQYRTVQAAVDAVPANNPSRVLISVKPGTYRETVKVPSNKPHVTVQGTGGSRKNTVIVFNNAAGTPKPDGSGTHGTSGSATTTVRPDGFTAHRITFANDWLRTDLPGTSGTQAVALKVQGDRSAFTHCRFLGHQDTLYADSRSSDTFARQYFSHCYAEGDVDFVFGRATAVFEHCHFRALNRPDLTGAPYGFVFAPSTAGANPRGYLVTRSTVSSEAPDGHYKLARPWVPSSDPTARPMLTVRDTRLGSGIDAVAPYATMAAGHPWQDQRFAEYRNSGPGAVVTVPENRPQLTRAQAAAHTPRAHLGDWHPRPAAK